MNHAFHSLFAVTVLSICPLATQAMSVVAFQTDPDVFTEAVTTQTTHFETVTGGQGLALAYGFDLATVHDWWTTAPGDWELDSITVQVSLGSTNTQNVTLSVWTGGTNGFDEPLPTTLLGGVGTSTISITAGNGDLNDIFTLNVSGALRTATNPLSGTGGQDYIWFVLQGDDNALDASLTGHAVTTGSAIPVWDEDLVFGNGWGASPLIWKGSADVGGGTFTGVGATFDGSGIELIGNVTLNFVPVPEPSSALLLGPVGILPLLRRRRSMRA